MGWLQELYCLAPWDLPEHSLREPLALKEREEELAAAP